MNAATFGFQMKTAQEMAYIALDFVSKNILNIIASAVVLLLGWILAKFFGKILQILLLRRKADVTITKFLVDILMLLIMCGAILIALGNFGITIAPFIAGLGALGFGASFALQGPLSNYAAGATLIFTKPFKVGDIVEVNGQVGEVVDMTLARTLMRTLDGTLVIIPNKKVIGEIMHNYSQYKRLDIKVGVAYSADTDKAISLIRGIVASDKRVISHPQAKVGISEFGDSGISLYARLWCKQSDYWDLMFDTNRSVLEAFRKNSINIPFPQREVRIIGKE